jgi:hypothetical protein
MGPAHSEGYSGENAISERLQGTLAGPLGVRKERTNSASIHKGVLSV